MPDYKNGKIYTIRCRNDPTLIYVGSTTQTLSQRWTDHKRRSNTPSNKSYNTHIYQIMREKGVDSFYIELLEEFPCENKEQLCKQEGIYIRQIGILNLMMTGRTKKEYREDNKEKIKEQRKEYNELNKDKIREYKKENKDKIKEQTKEYKERNKDRINEKERERYQKKKEMGITTICECGITFLTHKSRHEKSKKHLELMEAKKAQQDTVEINI